MYISARHNGPLLNLSAPTTIPSQFAQIGSLLFCENVDTKLSVIDMFTTYIREDSNIVGGFQIS